MAMQLAGWAAYVGRCEDYISAEGRFKCHTATVQQRKSSGPKYIYYEGLALCRAAHLSILIQNTMIRITVKVLTVTAVSP